MPRKKQFEEHEVIQKAMHTFWLHGYEGTSVRQLETDMGINQFSIYATFGSKKGLFLKVLDHYKFQIKSIFLSHLVQSEGALEDIRHFFNAFIQSVKTGKTPNGCLMANTAMDMGTTDKEVRRALQLFFTMLKDAFLQLLHKSKERGELSQNADVVRYANYLVGCTEGLAVTTKILDESQLQDFVDVAMKSIQ
ncbi:TetR/AcrR family transcriptional regulator [Arenibacter sp. GZD96]|uniref:TetR/AcrR family transcriptional regulator n=1 Tax=Aurantibrevibacter litoralis TaxID=3106030 RepID=UPI002B00116B|nr:TetR/AcrR family transcriptional regulator [Arenibacter sp. GZD-96]MEA1786071.1 TetR/AcrR family transcriptional regulator [Arenibacter sp. GZD-96]